MTTIDGLHHSFRPFFETILGLSEGTGWIVVRFRCLSWKHVGCDFALLNDNIHEIGGFESCNGRYHH